MIVFDLQCSNGHLFEGWFDSLESFEEQNAKKMVNCPYCDDSKVKKILSPVAVKKTNQSGRLPDNLPIDYQRLAKEVVEYVQKNSEDVGTRFAAEALKMHYGVTEKKSIRGSATEEEEKSLKDEGVAFLKIPTLKDDDKKDS